MKKRFDFCKRNFYCTREVCNMENTQIKILFINGSEVIQDIIVEGIASTIKPLVNRKGCCYHCKSENAVIIET